MIDMSLFFRWRIRSLSLASNKIKIIRAYGISQFVEELDLSDNHISVFEVWSHIPITLKKLNLTRNKINSIKESVVNAYTGTEIDFRGNNISNIIKDSNSSSKLDNSPRLYLTNNPLERNCEVTTVLKNWKINGLLIDDEDITFADGEYLTNTKIYLVCNNGDVEIGLIGLSTVGALVAVIIIVSIIRSRNQIYQYITNIKICNRNRSNPATNEITLNRFYMYDLFVSFAHQDSELVIDDLLPKLENKYHQKVCVHYRDWRVGELIPDQIIKSVENSRMTLILLTEHFLESQWSQLEFCTAHNLGKQEKRPRVIIIVMKEYILRSDKLTPELKSYIETNKYLVWSHFDFWENLQQELPRKGRKLKGSRDE